MIVHQTGSISSPIHHRRGINFYNINYYAILKEYLQLLHKIDPKEFQVKLEESSVMRFSLVEIDTYLSMRFVLCA